MAKTAAADKSKTDEKTRLFALLFELENLAVEGRKTTYDVLKTLLVDKGVDLTRELFIRYCLGPSPQQYLPALFEDLGKKRLSAGKMAAEVNEGVSLSLADSRVRISPVLSRILTRCKEQNMALGVVTALEEKVADGLAERLGLKEMGVKLLCSSQDDREFPTADAWLKLGKKMMSVSQVLCTALTTSGASCRAALSAGMRCIVIPDEFTAFQDFGGVDLVVDEFTNETLEEIMSIVNPADASCA